MIKDPSNKIGLKVPAFTYLIERGKIKEFAMAIGDENPLYYEREVAETIGFRDIPIPPTFATAMEMWAGLGYDGINELLDIEPLNVLHGEQSYEYIKDICANDVLTGAIKVVSAVTKKNMNLFTLETTYHNQENEIVLIGRSTIIEKLG